jgi:hypothetical protein
MTALPGRPVPGTTRSHDTTGPRVTRPPDARPLTRGTHLRWVISVTELLVAASALYGGIGLILDNRIGMLDEWLDGTPFTSWTLPGVFLLVVVAIPMLLAATLEIRRSAWAPWASIGAGAAQIGWVGVQLLVMQRYNVQQPMMLGFGLLILLLSVWARRAQPLSPRDPDGGPHR